MKSSVKNLVVWSKNEKSTKKHLWELQQLCGRTSGKGGMSRSSNQGWWTSEVADAVCENKEAWKEIEKNKERGNQLDARMIHTYGQKKRAANIVVDARRNMEADGLRQGSALSPFYCLSW